jgi:pimeloyl-ACP methyl ester carboxylesterase
VEYLTAGGDRLEYRWIPPRHSRAPVLVLLHEALGAAGQWRDFPDRLAARTGAAAMVYSRAGHGRSTQGAGVRGPDHFAREARVLRELVAARGIARPVLIGHSDGATIALTEGASEGSIAAGMILEAPHVFIEEITVAGVAAARTAFIEGKLRLRLARWHDHVDSMFYRWADTWLDPSFRQWSMTAMLPRIRCPLLVIQGEADPYGTVAQVAAISGGASGSVETLVLPRGGHAPHAERPEDVLDAMAGFVERLADEPRPA